MLRNDWCLLWQRQCCMCWVALHLWCPSSLHVFVSSSPIPFISSCPSLLLEPTIMNTSYIILPCDPITEKTFQIILDQAFQIPLMTPHHSFLTSSESKSSHSNMPLPFSAFGRLHWAAWSCFNYQPQEWMGHQEVWLRDFAIPNKQCNKKTATLKKGPNVTHFWRWTQLSTLES